jgi:DNA-binding NarL/FixJ family response regulator
MMRRSSSKRVSPRVLIVDDHAGFRSMARRLLQAGGYDVVGEAADGSAAMQAARQLLPDLVLLDIQLPDVDGCEVARWLAAEANPPAVVLISSRDAEDYGARLAGCGARGFVAKADLSGATIAALLDLTET